MDAALWQRVKAVLAEALEATQEERSGLLDRLCKNDAELRAEVESLLAAQQGNTDFIERPAAVDQAELTEGFARAGLRIGPYRLEERLGQGGMGVVHLASRVDGAYEGNVAVKLLPQWMASSELLRRFRNERQILASLEHPNIARLLDGGTLPDGSPYIVMEYVKGETIDHYCEAANLQLDQRLDLFLPIASAVQYAHQRLVIHRDLKPANILVTAEGVPKLLDFGIAKLADPGLQSEGSAHENMTREMRAFTPAFASPEQIRGEPVTTATDVHALGTLLYVLLTGRNPFSEKTTTQQQVMDAVCNRDAPPASSAAPAALRAALSGDLDNIVAKALAKEPGARYATVAEMVEDVRRYREGQPVLAKPRNWLYYTGKFARRNRLAVSVGAAALVSLCIAFGAVFWQMTIARAERERAEQHFNSVRKLANSLLFELNDEIEKGPTKARQLMVAKAIQYLNELASETGVDRALQHELALGYERIASIQGNPQVSNVGDPAGAMVNYRKSLDMRERLLKEEPANASLKRDLARTYEGLGNVLIFGGKLRDAEAAYQRAMTLAEELARASPTDSKAQLALAAALTSAAFVQYRPGHSNLGNMAGALGHHERALAIREAVAAAQPGDDELRLAPDITYQTLADLHLLRGKPETSLAMARKCEALLERVAQTRPDDARLQRRMALCYRKSAHALVELGDFTQGLEYAKKSLALRERMARADPTNVRSQRDLALGHGGVGNVLEASGNTLGALESYGQWSTISAGLMARNPQDKVLRNNVLESHASMGDALFKMGRTPQAIEYYRKALSASEKVIPDGDGGKANLRAGLGTALARQGKLEEARPLVEGAVTAHRKLQAADPNNAWALRDLALALEKLATLQGRLGDTQGNCATLKEASQSWRSLRELGMLTERDKAEPARLASAASRCES
jgi:eukaryotic-like serine/threonine-protein kinase